MYIIQSEGGRLSPLLPAVNLSTAKLKAKKMTKLLIKAAAILAVSELAVMGIFRFSGVTGTPLEVALDPLLMLLLALGPLYLLLRKEKAELEKRENLDGRLHSIMNGLWSASLHTLSVETLLEQILKEIIDLSPISLKHKGAIFLTEAGALHLKTSIGYPEEQKRTCGVVPPGKCLCGTVLKTGESIYSEGVDEEHTLHPHGMLPHGHYCVPIKSGEKVLGVLTLYLEPGHRRDKAEENFLMSVCAIIARILEGKKMEQSLFQIQKTAALNRFAAGIAHDFNNILQTIRSYCDLTARLLPPSSLSECNIGEIREAIGRGEALTRQLKLFSRQEKEPWEIFDINPELERAGSMIRRLMGSGISVDFRLSPPPLTVRGSRSRLEQLLMNLATNARDAMPAGGRFAVETRATEVCFIASKRTFSGALITALDTGEGMSGEVLKNIFEPFFTTKQEGKGSGLGLSIIHGIVQQHGGEVTVRSVPGEGTRFDIFLPLAKDGVSQ